MAVTCAMTGTLAKYVSAVNADTQNVRVAAWNIQYYTGAATTASAALADTANWAPISALGNFTLLNVTTIYTDGKDQDQENNTTIGNQWEDTENSITPSSTYGITSLVVAPGMGSYKSLILRNLSEVPAKVTISFDGATTNPKMACVKLAVTDTAITAADFASDAIWNGDLAVGVPASASDIVLAAGGATAVKVGFAWKWDFSPDDDPALADALADAVTEAVEAWETDTGLTYPDDYTAGDDTDIEDALAALEAGESGDTALGIEAASGTDNITAALKGAQILFSQED
jgi:hypothetical protein